MGVGQRHKRYATIKRLLRFVQGLSQNEAGIALQAAVTDNRCDGTKRMAAADRARGETWLAVQVCGGDSALLCGDRTRSEKSLRRTRTEERRVGKEWRSRRS